MPDAPLRLPARGPTLTIDVGVDFSEALRRFQGRYERHLSRLLPRLLPRDGVAFDVGANAGAVTLSMAYLAPDGQVVAFEAAPENANRLAANVARSGFRNIRIERLALYDSPGKLRLDYDEQHSGGAHVSSERPDPGAFGVEAAPLDDWVAAAGVERLDVVKIDVEGSEVRVLRGGQETLSRFRPTLIVECNPVTLGFHDHASMDDLLDALEQAGYSWGWITGRGGVIPMSNRTRLGAVLAATGIVDLLATTEAKPTGLRDIQAVLGHLRALQRVRSAHPRRRPPHNRFIIGPNLDIDVASEPRAARAGRNMDVDLELRNIGAGWISSDFEPHPVFVTYRWIDLTGVEHGIEPRVRIPRPMRPGDSCELTLVVDVPTDPGQWTLVVRAVQEHFAWLHATAPHTPQRIPVVVTV